MTFSQKVIRFNKKLAYTGDALPAGIRVMNPFKESKQASYISEIFYKKYYSDDKQRHLILGINPGRFGAGCCGAGFRGHDDRRSRPFQYPAPGSCRAAGPGAGDLPRHGDLPGVRWP